MKRTVISLFAACCLFTACNKGTSVDTTANYNVVPLPQEISMVQGDGFELRANTVIAYSGDEAMKRNAELLTAYIKESTGLELAVAESEIIANNAINLVIDNVCENNEGYRMSVTKENVEIAAPTAAGVFYGMQTLRKSLPTSACNKVELPAVTINDYPRFAYRGAHLDVSRHYFTKDSIKRFIDMLAMHNMNRFHWHLTDDQGWRIEIKKYPKLTTVAAERDETVIGRNSGEYDGQHYGPFFYTQDDCREIVAYAAERHITVIPEIDLPGHMQAALAAYPEYGCTGGPYEVWKMWGVSDNVLCAGNDATLKFIEDVLDEVIEVFPSEYIHVGGDECPKTQWEQCPKCQARIKALGIKGDDKHSAEMYLQSFVINHAEKYLNSKGRQIIGWDEILEGGLAPNATVHSWRGIEGGIEAAKQGHDCIMSPTSFMYFDYYQTTYTDDEPLAIGGYVPVEKVYSFEPMDESLTPEEQKHIIGVQANLWSEYVPTFSHVEYMELPRMAALCEVQWCNPEKKDFNDFKQRLMPLLKLYEVYGYNYAKHILDIEPEFSTDTERGVIVATLRVMDDTPIYYTLDGSEPTTESALYTAPIEFSQSCTFKAKGIGKRGATRTLTEEIYFNKATAKPITLLQDIHKNYTFKGAITLVDGLKGSPNYRTGRWLGFCLTDLEAVIDLKQEEEISCVSFNTSVDKGDWVFDLLGLTVSVSNDGENYTTVFDQEYPDLTAEDENRIYGHKAEFEPVKARYVKVMALSDRDMPAWHPAVGYPAFIFVDELEIN
ncbi:MAG: family 20 glycosylhydrolase [Bacteroidaceae bacterium]|nr:family 20 glycosylhydrolase [Bacteroidaceae bacterium]